MGDDHAAHHRSGAVPISIHVPRMGDDPSRHRGRLHHGMISIHVPRMGDDAPATPLGALAVRFLSTSPVWGTTADVYSQAITSISISIHVPRMGDDLACPGRHADGGRFLSTSPVWGTTCTSLTTRTMPRLISIHVPRMGDDDHRQQHRQHNQHFYPRPPYGGRPEVQEAAAIITKFLSTSPVWGTTDGV